MHVNSLCTCVLPGREGGETPGIPLASVFKTNISDLLYDYYYYRAMGDIIRFCNDDNTQ